MISAFVISLAFFIFFLHYHDISVSLEAEKALLFQKTMLEDSSAQAMDKSSAPTRHRKLKFPAAVRDIQAPVGITMARNIRNTGL